MLTFNVKYLKSQNWPIILCTRRIGHWLPFCDQGTFLVTLPSLISPVAVRLPFNFLLLLLLFFLKDEVSL